MLPACKEKNLPETEISELSHQMFSADPLKLHFLWLCSKHKEQKQQCIHKGELSGTDMEWACETGVKCCVIGGVCYNANIPACAVFDNEMLDLKLKQFEKKQMKTVVFVFIFSTMRINIKWHSSQNSKAVPAQHFLLLQLEWCGLLPHASICLWFSFVFESPDSSGKQTDLCSQPSQWSLPEKTPEKQITLICPPPKQAILASTGIQKINHLAEMVQTIFFFLCSFKSCYLILTEVFWLLCWEF